MEIRESSISLKDRAEMTSKLVSKSGLFSYLIGASASQIEMFDFLQNSARKKCSDIISLCLCALTSPCASVLSSDSTGGKSRFFNVCLSLSLSFSCD